MSRPAKTLARARQLRHEPTEVELQLWQYIRGYRLEGFRFRRQHPVGPYILDFYCSSAKLAVEVDGSGHLDTVPHDEQRAAWLESKGIRVLRFWNHQVGNEREQVLEAILDALRAPPPPLRGTSPSEEGEE